MRRIALSLALLASLLIPASASAAAERCSLEISPAVGSPTDVYRILVTNVPVLPDGGSVEVRVDIVRLGSREGTIYFAHLIPGVTEFYIDHNYSYPEEPPADPLVPGRYRVTVSTPHIHGACRDTGGFAVRA
jgi:hypothetical protein